MATGSFQVKAKKDNQIVYTDTKPKLVTTHCLSASVVHIIVTTADCVNIKSTG